MTDKTYTTHEVARFCDVYPSTVVNWIRSGRLTTSKTLGGHHRVAREALVSLLARMNIAPPPELAAVAGKRVLIVDDDPEVSRVLQRAFARRPEGFAVEACRDGVEALIRIGQSPPDLVVLDVVLPKMDGLQVCRVLKAKAETRGIKIVAISGKKTAPDGRLFEDALKADAFFRKPLDLAALTARSCALLGLAGARSAR